MHHHDALAFFLSVGIEGVAVRSGVAVPTRNQLLQPRAPADLEREVSRAVAVSVRRLELAQACVLQELPATELHVGQDQAFDLADRPAKGPAFPLDESPDTGARRRFDGAQLSRHRNEAKEEENSKEALTGASHDGLVSYSGTCPLGPFNCISSSVRFHRTQSFKVSKFHQRRACDRWPFRACLHATL